MSRLSIFEVSLMKCKLQMQASWQGCMKTCHLGWDRRGGRSGTLERKRINKKVLRGMNSSPAEKQKTTLGELSEAAAYSKNNSACSFAQISCSLFFFCFSLPFPLSFPLIDKRKNWCIFFSCLCFLFQNCWNLAIVKRLEKLKIKNTEVYATARKLTQNFR